MFTAQIEALQASEGLYGYLLQSRRASVIRPTTNERHALLAGVTDINNKHESVAHTCAVNVHAARGTLIQQGLTSPIKHIIGHTGDGFYGSNDPTNSVKALKHVESKLYVNLQILIPTQTFLTSSNKENHSVNHSVPFAYDPSKLLLQLRPIFVDEPCLSSAVNPGNMGTFVTFANIYAELRKKTFYFSA